MHDCERTGRKGERLQSCNQPASLIIESDVLFVLSYTGSSGSETSIANGTPSLGERGVRAQLVTDKPMAQRTPVGSL